MFRSKIFLAVLTLAVVISACGGDGGDQPPSGSGSTPEDLVEPHHWDFGPMPPQPDVSRADVEAIVAYVRAEQKEAGIFE
jgi:hypothetical protein